MAAFDKRVISKSDNLGSARAREALSTKPLAKLRTSGLSLLNVSIARLNTTGERLFPIILAWAAKLPRGQKRAIKP